MSSTRINLASYSPSQRWIHETSFIYSNKHGNAYEIFLRLFGTSDNIQRGSSQKSNVFRLQMYERVGVSLVEVYEKVKRLKRG